MQIERMNYRFFPRQGEAVGACTLHYPFLPLWSQMFARFLQQAVSLLVQGVALPPLEDLLDEHRLGPLATSLDEWFQHYAAPPLALGQNATSLNKLADTTEDLAREDGLWKEQAADLDNAEQDALAELQLRLQGCCASVAAAYGPGAVRTVLAAQRQAFASASVPWQAPEVWTTRQSEELRLTALSLRTYARPRSLRAKVFQWLRPQASLKLTASQERNLKRKLQPMIDKANRQRFQHAAARRKRKVYEALLGQPGHPGLLDTILTESLAQDEYFKKLREACAPPAAEHVESGNVIKIVTDLDTPLASGRKLYELFEEKIAAAGCTPHDFAAMLQHEGLMLHGRLRKPVEWTPLPLPDVLEALQAAANHYLGSDNFARRLDVENPKTAFEAVATVTPGHAELRPLMEKCLPQLIERSTPYVELNPVARGAMQVHSFLYCHPSLRQRLERYLHGMPLANSSSTAGNIETYSTKHPFLIMLVQYAIAVPLGALKSLPQWIRQTHLLQSKGRQPFFDFSGRPEVCRLESRPVDYEDRRQLFAAALKARVFVPTDDSAGLFTLLTEDPDLAALFCETELVPVWKPAGYFKAMLQKPVFIQSLEIAFPAVRGLTTKVSKLAQEHDAVLAAQALVSLGILEAGDSPQHFRIHSQSQALPYDLFEKRKIAAHGLSREQCIAALDRHGDHHDLYNYVFWQVRKALDMERISPNDVPPFLLTYARSVQG